MSADTVYSRLDELDGTLAPGQLPNSGVTPGTYALATVTVDVHGIVTAIAAGSGGGAGGGPEADPIFAASPAEGITTTQITHWNTAYSWGNHAVAGYALNSDVVHTTGSYADPAWITSLSASKLGPVMATGTTTARALAVRFAEVVNVKDCGATGNGVTDDTTALLAAVVAAVSRAPATLFFPPGIYLTTAALRPEADDIDIVGYGATIKIVANTVAILVNKGTSSPPTPVSRLRIRGLRVDASSGHGLDSTGLIQLNNAVDFSIEDCTILGPGAALSDAFAVSQGSSGVMARCTVDGVNKSGFYQSTGSGYCEFIACTARHIRGTVGAVGFLVGLGGCTLSASTADDCAGAAIMMNAIGASGPYPAQAPEGVTIQGGRFTNSQYGMQLASAIAGVAPADIRVSGALFAGNTFDGVLITQGSRVQLVGNTFDGNGYAGVNVGAPAQQVQVQGGTFRNNGRSLSAGLGMGVYVRGAAQVQVIGGHYTDDQTTQSQYYAVMGDAGPAGEVIEGLRVVRPGVVAPVLSYGSLTTTAPTNTAIDISTTSVRTTANPLTGTNPQGAIAWTTDPSSAGWAGSICTVAGTPGTSRLFGPLADSGGKLPAAILPDLSGTYQPAGSYAVTNNNLSDLASAGTARTNLGLGTAATHPATDFQAAGSYLVTSNNLSDLASATTARSNLGLGSAATHAATDFQVAGSYLVTSNNLSDLASASTARTNLGLGTAATHAATDFQTAGSYLVVTNNLSDLASAATARTNLGLGTAATHPAGDFAQTASNLSDLSSAATARSNLGVGAAHRAFGVSGTPALNATTPPLFLDRAYTCDGLAAACGTAPSGGAATVTVQSSTDGATWTTLGAVSITSGTFSGTTILNSAVTANTFIRGKFTAVNGAADMTATLFLKG